MIIHVANNLPDRPLERYEGEQFRNKFLLPALEKSAPTETILIDFDGKWVGDYNMGFLKGIFDTPPEDYTRQQFFDKLKFKTIEKPLLVATIAAITLDVNLTEVWDD